VAYGFGYGDDDSGDEERHERSIRSKSEDQRSKVLKFGLQA
jgi:hypothetical protein